MNSKALNGFLEKIKLQHNLSFKAVYFEENFVDPQQVAYWLEKLQSICEDYATECKFII